MRSSPARRPIRIRAALKRALALLDELWRRSGGRLAGRRADGAARADPLAARAGGRAGRSSSAPGSRSIRRRWSTSRPARGSTRCRPWSALRGDAVPLDYELADGQGVARVRLREGQARRLRDGDLPPLDRPLRFAGAARPARADPGRHARRSCRRRSSARRARRAERRRGPHARAGGPRGPRRVGPGRRRPLRRRGRIERRSIVHPGLRCTS